MGEYYKEINAIAIGLGFLFLLDPAGKGDAAKTFKFSSLNCQSINKSVAEFTECKIHFKQRRSVFSVNVTLNAFVDNAELRLRAMKKHPSGGWRPFFYDKTTDCCEFLRNPKKHVVLYAIFNYAKRYHNVRHKCPYNSSDYIRFANLEIGDDMLNVFPLDIGEYGLFTYWYTDKKLVAYVNGSMIFSDYSRIF